MEDRTTTNPKQSKQGKDSKNQGDNQIPLLEIALGKSRKETNWKNTEITWEAFVKKLSQTHRTAETHTDYIAAPKSRQDEIKDNGGFVGGFVINGRRKKGNILNRTILTLDIDHCPASFDPWEVFTLLYECAACVYSTHKHSPTAKRLRLVIPFSRELTPEEYVAVCRKVAGDIGIEVFDDTTFQPHRLMYWPSTSKDGEFYFREQEGGALDVDEALSSYTDWRDASSWPVSSRVDKAIEREAKKQGDPTEKPGIIGAVCRTYTIEEVIETFLADKYEACDIEGRYTYKQGSTSGGVIVYEGKWSYSHHETDPASGKLCNAFDLLRVHKFGLKDEDVREGTPVNRLPSYKAAIDFFSKVKAVKRLIGEERLSSALEDFREALESGEVDTAWLEDMETDGRGNYLSTAKNIELILDNDPKLKGCFAYDIFERVDRVMKDPPWMREAEVGSVMLDTDDQGLRVYIETTYGITGTAKISDALGLCTKRNSFHPVRGYLEKQTWDGIERLDGCFMKYLGAEDCSYVRAVTRKSLTAAVARIYEPGCKFDYVLTFVGGEGVKKSSVLYNLGKGWFSDSFVSNSMSGKDAYEQLQGVWIIEMAELVGVSKAEIENTKHFITKRRDRYRPAYGKRVVEYPRQCVFFATTNDDNFLRGFTGNRRFWPVRTGKPEADPNEMEEYEIDQIWAEAKYRYQQGEALWLEELEEEARKQQERHTEEDTRIGLIEKYLETLLPENWVEMDIYARCDYFNNPDEIKAQGVYLRDKVCALEIWCECFGNKKAEATKYSTKEIHQMMKKIEGWEADGKRERMGVYGLQRLYYRSM